MTDSVSRQALILLTGHPSTGKTTSTQRLHLDLMNEMSVSVLTTLSVRQELRTLDKLDSANDRQAVYDRLVQLVEENVHERRDVIILDGNFNTRDRRQQVYDVAAQHDLDIYLIECVVRQRDVVRQRLAQRKEQIDNPQHRAASIELYDLIRSGSDPVQDDLLADGRRPVTVEYDTETETVTVHKARDLGEEQERLLAHIIRALRPGSAERPLAVPGSPLCEPQAFIFDIGGVTQPLRWDLVTEELRKVKPDLTVDEFRNGFYHEREKGFSLYETAKLDASDFWTMVAAEIEFPRDRIEFMSDAFSLLYSSFDKGLETVLERLEGRYRLFVLSNSCGELERATGTFEASYRRFEQMYFSHKIGYKKPDLESFRYVLEDTNLDAGDCVFVDDVSANVIAAQTLGIRGVLYVSSSDLENQLAEYLG